MFSCSSSKNRIKIDQSKHVGLTALQSDYVFKTLYSTGKLNEATEKSHQLNAAYDFLSELMGPKEDFSLLVVAREDWEQNAYLPVVGLPQYYKGNIIVGAGKSDIALDYEKMIRSFPEDMVSNVIKTYTNDCGEFDMGLYFQKLAIHELTHSFQDPKNMEGFSMLRWLEEVHANMGLYAYFKSKKSNEVKYITEIVDFSLQYPPPSLKYTSLDDFDAHYYDIDPANYGYYQMKFTKMGQHAIDSLGISILDPINKFVIRYDESWQNKLAEDEIRQKIASEVDPYLVELIENWEDL